MGKQKMTVIAHLSKIREVRNKKDVLMFRFGIKVGGKYIWCSIARDKIKELREGILYELEITAYTYFQKNLYFKVSKIREIGG